MKTIRSARNVFFQHSEDENSFIVAVDRQHGQHAPIKMGLVQDRDGVPDKNLVLFVRSPDKVFEVDRLYYLPGCTPPFWWERFRDGDQQTLQDVKARLRYLGANTRHIADGEWERYRIGEPQGPTNYTFFSQKIDVIEALKAKLYLGIEKRGKAPPSLLVFLREYDRGVSDFARVYHLGQSKDEPLEWHWPADTVDVISRDESAKLLTHFGFAHRTVETMVRLLGSNYLQFVEEC